MQIGADILLVLATLVAARSFLSIVSAWTVRRWPIVPLVSFAIAAGLFAYIHLEVTDGLVPVDIPNAFISVAARILN